MVRDHVPDILQLLGALDNLLSEVGEGEKSTNYVQEVLNIPASVCSGPHLHVVPHDRRLPVVGGGAVPPGGAEEEVLVVVVPPVVRAECSLPVGQRVVGLGCRKHPGRRTPYCRHLLSHD